MPRQPKWVAAGIYQPTYQPRHAYGPRRWGRRELVEEVARQCEVIDAASVARYGDALGQTGPQVVSVPMPRGGVRWLFVCPRCDRHATRLYDRWHQFYRRYCYACRSCWGMYYQSQYAGRRLEAHPEYLATLRQRLDAEAQQVQRWTSSGYNPFASPRRKACQRTHTRRTYRYLSALDSRSQRQARYIARKDLASDLALFILVGRSEAKQRRSWSKFLRQVLWHGHLDTIRELIAMPDTPEWVRQVLIDALRSDMIGVKKAKTRRKLVKNAVESDEKAHLAAIIDQAQLDELRAAYAALGQARRAKRAA